MSARSEDRLDRGFNGKGALAFRLRAEISVDKFDRPGAAAKSDRGALGRSRFALVAALR
jgi:hypothetical protein